MADKFDAYREALVLEETTIWGDEHGYLEAGEKATIATALHNAWVPNTNCLYDCEKGSFCVR